MSTKVGTNELPVLFNFDRDVHREWLQFTRSCPTGLYAVYLRAAVWNLREAELALEVVTGNSSLPNAASTALGRFKAGATGFAYRNIPLSNAEGQTLALSLSGRQTIRLRQITDSSEAGDVVEDYLAVGPDRKLCQGSVPRVAHAGAASAAWAVTHSSPAGRNRANMAAQAEAMPRAARPGPVRVKGLTIGVPVSMPAPARSH